MPLGVYDREMGAARLAAHRFCGLSDVCDSPGWVCVAIWPCECGDLVGAGQAAMAGGPQATANKVIH
jgi:hypothetical protein